MMLEKGLIKYSVYFVPKNKDVDIIIDQLFEEKIINFSDISGMSHYVVGNETLDPKSIESLQNKILKRIQEIDNQK